MSRQRIRTSVLESSTEKCPHCGGTGHVRSVSSVTLQLLRTLDETLIKGGTHNLIVRTRADVALYVLNHKRAHLRDLEQRLRVTITINADAAIAGQQVRVATCSVGRLAGAACTCRATPTCGGGTTSVRELQDGETSGNDR